MSTEQAREDLIQRLRERQPEHFEMGQQAGKRAVEVAVAFMDPVAFKNNAGNMIIDAKDEVIEKTGFIPPYDAAKADQLWAIHYGAETTVLSSIKRITGVEA